MADVNEVLRSKHGFGATEGIDAAITAGKIDEYDILFLDGDTKPTVGWIDAKGNVRIVDTEKVVVVKEDALPETGVEGKIYIFNGEGYFWDGTAFVNLCKPTDLSALEEKVAGVVEANAELEQAVTENNEKLEAALVAGQKQEYEVAYKPAGTVVDYRDKEIRVMCPTDTEWELQQSGENADANKYYIGFKAYAPEDAVSFKEDIAEIIADNTMYYFENNEFAGVDNDGRKYSVIWLPAAVYDEETAIWTYYGTNSSAEKYIGWYYSVEWYNAEGVMIHSDCIRINLTNEECHSSIKPFYLTNTTTEAVNQANAYTDEQIASILNSFTVVEF